MADVGLSDILSLVQTIAIISALLMTLYFSRRQLAGFAVDLETRVLNDLDEKFHRIGEIFIARPELTRMVYQSKERLDPETPLAYYILFFCAHIYHMRQRGILRENEWQGWLQWMRNAFQLGTIATNWKEG
ncbi:MAG TPA: hypothetical protein VIZ68_00315, partial [Thermoplasmata archaeon]